MEIMSESDSDRLSVNRFFRAETYDNVQNIIDYFFQAVIQYNSCEENIESWRNVDDLKFSLFFVNNWSKLSGLSWVPTMPPQQIQRSKLRFSALCIYFQRWIPHMYSNEFHANICTIYWCCWDYLENKNNENLVTRIIGAWSKRRTHLVDKFAFDGRVNHQIAHSDH